MDWRNETRACHCGNSFKPKRETQRHCSPLCRDKAAKRRSRSMDKSEDQKPDLSVVPRSMDTPVTRQSEASEMDSWPICPVCGLWQVMPKQGLPRHMFCIAVRKAARGDKDAIAFLERCKPSLREAA